MFAVDLRPLVDVLLKVTVVLARRAACRPRAVAPLSRGAASDLGRRTCRVADDARPRGRRAAVDDCGAARAASSRRDLASTPARDRDRDGRSGVRADSGSDTERESGATASGGISQPTLDSDDDLARWRAARARTARVRYRARVVDRAARDAGDDLGAARSSTSRDRSASIDT